MSDTELETLQLARLLDGMTALDQGQLGIAKYRFNEIIHASAKPQLEAGHAWRGLAEISVRRGDIGSAETQLQSAVRAYRDIGHLDATARARAGEGEGSALLLGAELLLRRGLADAGRRILVRTAEVLAGLGDDRSAEAWAATGRLALHLHRPKDADRAFRGALSRYEKVGNVAGHAEVLLEAAALKRDLGDEGSAGRMLDIAASMARNAGRLSTAARAHLGRAQLSRDPSLQRDAWEDAFEAATSAGDLITTGFALLGLGANGWQDGEQPLLAGAQLLLDGGHFPGLGLGLLRIGEHCIRQEEPEVALVACEGAWRVYRGLSPVDGIGRVLRVAVKAFAELKEPRPTLVAAYARAALAGKRDPHAIEVRDHYVRLAPASLTMQLARVPTEELVQESRRAIQSRIVPALRQYGLLAQSFATAQGALDVMGVMLGISPRGAVRALVPAPDTALPDDLRDPTLPESDDLTFGRRSTLRINVAAAVDSPMLDQLRSPVYDPDGRLAALASQSLVFVDDEVDAEDDEDTDPTMSDMPSTLRAPDEPMFPDDSGVVDWMKFSGTEATWGRGAAQEGEHELISLLEREGEDGEVHIEARKLPEGAFPARVPDADDVYEVKDVSLEMPISDDHSDES